MGVSRQCGVKDAIRSPCATLLILCIAVTSAAAQEMALPPLTDQRAAEFPAIGRLGRKGFRTNQSCTATLIATDMVITAAHCVSDAKHAELVFVAGWSRGDYVAARTAQHVIIHPAYLSSVTQAPDNDIAMVILESPIENVTPVPLGEIKQGGLHGAEVALIGYHRKTPHILSGDFTCPVTNVLRGIVHVGCPVINGNSGAPLLSKGKRGAWQVVGVVSAQLGNGAIAVELSEWLRQEVASHPGR